VKSLGFDWTLNLNFLRHQNAFILTLPQLTVINGKEAQRAVSHPVA